MHKESGKLARIELPGLLQERSLLLQGNTLQDLRLQEVLVIMKEHLSRAEPKTFHGI